jgi:hypothetical protein
MIKFGNYRYIKEHISDNQPPVPVFVFNILSNDNDIVYICPYNDLETNLRNTCVNVDHDNYNIIYEIFVELFEKYKNVFSKKYNINNILAILEHIIVDNNFNVDDLHKSWLCVPKEIRIKNNKFYIYWSIKELSIDFDIQLENENINTHTIFINNKSQHSVDKKDIEVTATATATALSTAAAISKTKNDINAAKDTVAVTTTASNTTALDAINITNNNESNTNNSKSLMDDITFDDIEELNDKEVISLRLKGENMIKMNHNLPAFDERRQRDKKRVEEAQLRAKLAVYKAERLIQKYIQRYGDLDDLNGDSESEMSDFSDTDDDN